MDKLAIIQPLKLEEEHAIEHLIKGISILAIKSVAASIRADSVDYFLDEMLHITSTCQDSLRKNSAYGVRLERTKDNTPKFIKPKDQGDSNTKSGQLNQDSFCIYCRNRSYLREDCIKLKRKEQRQESIPLPAAQLVAAVSDHSTDTASVVAKVEEVDGRKIITNENILKIVKLNNINCNLIAFPDNGSPTSFICPATFNNFFKSTDIINVNSMQEHRTINNTPIPTFGSVSTNIELEALPNLSTSINLHILKNNLSSIDFYEIIKSLFSLTQLKKKLNYLQK